METSQPPKQIIILSGQSNMAGRGGVKNKRWDGVVPPECSPDSHKIFRLDAHLCWEVAREPVHHDIDTKKTCGVGPGMSFANAVKERVGTIGLVPCAVGGTAIKEWARGEHLYENMVKRAKAAVKGGEIKALLWYQGESDTSSQEDVDMYQQNMETFIHNVRADLNLPHLPIVQVALASGVKDELVEKIREIQLGIDMPNVVCVDAKGLELNDDNLHLTTDSQVRLAKLSDMTRASSHFFSTSKISPDLCDNRKRFTVEKMAAAALSSSSLCCYASIRDIRMPHPAKVASTSREFGTTFATGSPLRLRGTATHQRKTAQSSKSVCVRCEQSTNGGSGLDVWLGRLAMVGFAAAISVEIATGKGLLENFGLTSPLPTVALAVTALVGVLTAVFIFQSASKT